jgi:hypothetical protein
MWHNDPRFRWYLNHLSTHKGYWMVGLYPRWKGFFSCLKRQSRRQDSRTSSRTFSLLIPLSPPPFPPASRAWTCLELPFSTPVSPSGRVSGARDMLSFLASTFSLFKILSRRSVLNAVFCFHRSHSRLQYVELSCSQFFTWKPIQPQGTVVNFNFRLYFFSNAKTFSSTELRA